MATTKPKQTTSKPKSTTKAVKGARNHPQYVRLMEMTRHLGKTGPTQMAQALGVSLQTLYNWSQERKGISKGGLYAIANAFGHEMRHWVETGTGSMPRSPQATAESKNQAPPAPQPEPTPVKPIDPLAAQLAINDTDEPPKLFAMAMVTPDKWRVRIDTTMNRAQVEKLWSLMTLTE